MATVPAQSRGERIVTLDLIRGIAVMGIFSVNIVDFSMIQAAYLNPAGYGGWHGADGIVWALNMLFVDGKFRSLFSMLFGASMLLVIERAERSGESGWTVHWRRMAVLLAFGAAHAILLWRGDILTLYAMTGIVAYLFRKMTVEKLAALGLSLSLTNLLLFGAIAATLVHQDLVAHAPHPTAEILRDWNANAGSFFPTAKAIAADRAIYGGSWLAIVANEASGASQILVNNVLLLPDTLGLMLLGMAASRSGFLTGEWSDDRYRRIAKWGIAIGFAGFAGLVIADFATRFYVPLILGGFMAAMVPFRLAMAFGYAALIVLLFRRPGELRARFAAVGRAAFTNYLGTSIVATAVFYGWGLGLYGQVSRAEAWLLVPVVWALMLLWSKPWLDHFNYGPFEWAWRTLSRGKLQPMRKPRRAAAVAAA
jgi:uncharacterized protein